MHRSWIQHYASYKYTFLSRTERYLVLQVLLCDLDHVALDAVPAAQVGSLLGHQLLEDEEQQLVVVLAEGQVASKRLGGNQQMETTASSEATKRNNSKTVYETFSNEAPFSSLKDTLKRGSKYNHVTNKDYTLKINTFRSILIVFTFWSCETSRLSRATVPNGQYLRFFFVLCF